MSSPPEMVPLPVRLKRVYVWPTRYGVVLGVVLLLIVAGSLNYRNNMGLLFAFLIGGMSVVSAFHTHRNLTGVKLSAGSCRPAFAGQTARLTLELNAGSRRRAALQLSTAAGDAHRFDLAGHHQRVDVPIHTRSRGRIPVGALTVDTRYPLGIFRAWRTIVPDIHCLVWPAPLPGDTGSAQAGGGDQGRQPVKAPGVDDFEGLRPYQPGDSIRHIHWKAFSRGRGLQTKVFTATAGGARIIDWQETAAGDTETRLSRMCHAVLSAHAAGHAYGLKLPGVSIAPGSGTAHRNQCLRALAVFES